VVAMRAIQRSVARSRIPCMKTLRPSVIMPGLQSREDCESSARGIRGLQTSPFTANPLAGVSVLSPAEVGAQAAGLAPAVVTFLKVAPAVVSQALWLAPYPTIKEVEKDGSTGGLPPLGYFSMLTNGYLWMCYGYTAGMDMTIIAPNFTGMLAGGYYSYVFTKYDSGAFDLTPYKLGSASAIVAITGTALAFDAATAQNILGYAGCAVVVAMFSGPLITMKEVIETQSTKNLPAPMAIVTVINCTLWSSFGYFVINDAFVYAPNILGLASGITQVGLLAKYGIYKEPQTQVATETPETVDDKGK